MKRTILTTSLVLCLLASASALAMDSSALQQRSAGLHAGSGASMMQAGDLPVLASDSAYWEQRSARLHKATVLRDQRQVQRRSVREETPWWR
ncbi:hypothetical protein [Halomonas nitroreducens]|uniref:DUF4148 domain-containing protein n=1 Tax=Halomonas nitroreducens TaxID=447425 RepID=A0A3S0HUE1_9GAMM|nr:hypothetical protein [Halomonas nitroreducens]RTR05936.1 hypothetical protein EKG36_04080 [Halomonas nitroreducens]